jgi:hypothetical protein
MELTLDNKVKQLISKGEGIEIEFKECLNPISNTVYETILVSHPTNPLFKTGNFY